MSNSITSDKSFDEDLFKCILCSITVNDPVLLECLHSACTQCAVNSTPYVTCPLCSVTTDISTRDSNLLASALLNRSLIMKNDVFFCSRCFEDGKFDAPSVVWCYTCQKSLCTDCEKCHSRFNSTHKLVYLNEHTVLSELHRPPVRLCTKHGEVQQLACFSCKSGRCFKCAHECYTSSHDIQLLDDTSAVDRMNDQLVEATRMLAEIKLAKSVLHAYVRLPESIADARQESIIALKMAKQTALDSITRAYENAEESLEACWDKLTSKALVLREFVEHLQPRLEWTDRYCQIVLNTKDIAGLLPQLDAICSCLRGQLEDANQIKQPVEPSKLIRLNTCLPRDLDMITSGWFGQAKVVSDDFSCSIESLPADDSTDYYAMKVSTLHELQQFRDKQNGVQQHLERERQALEQLELDLKFNEQWLAQPAPLYFDENPRSVFEGPAKYWDVAVTKQNRLLVAAMADGLKEYDAACFQEITTWKPCGDLIGESKSASVTTVDALTDGRAIVGLSSAKLIVLLHRDPDGSDSWRVERRVVELQALPRRLSAWGNRLVAALEDKYDETAKLWQTGPVLVLVSLSGGCKVLSRRKLDYTAASVQMTDRGVVVASNNDVGLTEAAGNIVGLRKSHVIDCYSHAGVRLWRHEVSAGLNVMAICLDPVGRTLYAAMRGFVVALSVDDGKKLSTAIRLSTKDIEQPYAIGLNAETSRLLSLICFGKDQPNRIAFFNVL